MRPSRLACAACLAFAFASCKQRPASRDRATDLAVAALAVDAGAALRYAGHGASSVPPEVVARFAPKPLATDLRRRLERYFDLLPTGLGKLAPGGKRLFFTWRVTGTPQVWRIDGPGRFPVQMTGGVDATRVAAITPDGTTLVLSRDRQGEEDPGLYLQSANGGALERISHEAKVQTQLQHVTDDGRYLYFTSNKERPDSYALHRYDRQTRAQTTVFSEPGLWSVADVHPDGTFLLAKATGELWREYYRWRPNEGRPVAMLGIGEKEEYQATFGATSRELLVSTSKFGEMRRLYRFTPNEGTPPAWHALTPDWTNDIASFSIAYRRQRVLVAYNDGGYHRLAAYATKTFAPLPLPAFPGADHVFAGATTRDGDFTVIGVERPTLPMTTYVLEWGTSKLTEWITPSTPEVDTKTFARATLEHYPARDGTPIPMFVRRPKACAMTPCPVVVVFHGGPEGQALPGFDVRAQMFVEAGFVSVEPNVRGSDGYGKTWLRADDGPKRMNVITDIEDCARHIRARWSVDGRTPKIGVFGGSYGGYSALMAMTMFAGAYDAGVSWVGISNLVTFLQNTAPYRRIMRAAEYGDPVRDRAALLALSPVTYLDRVKGPLLLLQGLNDPRVPAGEALQVHEALRKRGRPAELIVFADEGHGAAKRANQVLGVGHALDFLQRHLLPRSAPATRPPP